MNIRISPRHRRNRQGLRLWVPVGLLLTMAGLGVLAAGSGGSRAREGAAVTASTPAAIHAARFTRCRSGAQPTCVVDGDTFRLDGVKIRVADIDTPETLQAQCAAERALGDAATLRMAQLLSAGPFALQPADRDADVYGRKLRIVIRDGRSLGDTLVAEGLARRWDGARHPWC